MPRARAAAIAAAAAMLMLTACGSSSPPAPTSTAKTAAPAQTAGTSGATTAAAPAPSTVTGNTVTSSAGPVTAVLRAPGHTPRVEAPWPIHVTVQAAGRPARATIDYQYLFAGQVVARRNHATFTGRYADVLKWPANSVGYPLTFRALITSGGRALALDYPVQVSR